MDEEQNNNLISYAEPDASVAEPIQIAEATPTADLPKPTQDSRTMKLTFGTPEMGMDYDQMQAEWQARGEQDMRTQAAFAKGRAQSIQNVEIVKDSVNKLGRNMTLPEAMLLQDLIKRKQADPNSVLEEGYAKNFMENLQKRADENPDSSLGQAMRQMPNATQDDFEKAQTYKETRELILTQLENAHAALQQQTLVGRGLDLGKYLLPLYQNFKLSGYTDRSFALDMGAEFNRQAADWFNMPIAQARVKIPATGKTLIEANPALAMTYFGSLLHQSSTEQMLNSIFPLLDVTTIGSLIKGGAALTARAADAISLSNAARKTVAEYAKSLEPEVNRSALHAATGDIQQAGVTQAAEEIIKNFQGKQVASPLQPLHSAFVSNLERIASDGSTFTRGLQQETVNRIVERAAGTYGDVLDKVAMSMKVDRIPAVIAFQRHYGAMVEQIKSDHPYMANSILDVKFRKDELGSLYADIYMGETGTTIFNTERQATNRIIEHGLGDAKPVEIYGPSKPITQKGTAGGFRTEQGSEYKINASGTTTRTATNIRPGDTVTFKDAPKPNKLAGTKWTPTREWQDVPKGTVLPAGLESQVDINKGIHRARIPAGSKDFPPDAVTKEITRTGTATGKTTITPHDNKRYYELVGKDGHPGWVAEDRLTITKPGPSQSARGVQSASSRTVYMDTEEARKIFPVQGDFRLIDHGNGTISMATPAKGGKSWGIAPSAKGAAYSTEAGVGKVPVELFKPDASLTTKGGEAFSSVHFGNQIKEMIAGREASVSIKNQGAGYYIVKTVPWDETNQLTRDLLLSHESARTPASLFNAYAGGLVGRLRTPEETLAYLQNVARKVATFGPSGYEKIINESVKEIAALGGLSSWIPGTKARQIWKDWERMMGLSWQMPHPETGKIGLQPAFRDVGELNQMYLNTLHRSPSEAEIAASFSYLRNHEILEAFKKINLMKAQTRTGTQTWTFGSMTAAKDTPKSTGYKTIEAEGTRETKFPGSGSILIVRGNHLDSERVLDLSKLQAASNKTAKAIRDAVEQGQGNLVKLTNPHDFPMKNWVGNQWVDYVYAENATSKAIAWDRLKTGRPSVYDYEHYVVQPIVHHDALTRRFLYLGDRTIAGHNLRAMSQDVAAKLNELRLLFKADDIDGARAVYAKSTLPQSFDTIHSWFKPEGVTTEGYTLAPKLSLDQPIKSAPLGKRTIDLDKEMYRDPMYKNSAFKDQTREIGDRFLESEYNKARGNMGDPFDIFTLRNEGTKANPDYKMGDLKTIDPMVSFQRAMSKAINSTYLDDYKVSAIEHWIQEAKPHLKISDRNLADSPSFYFYNHENQWLSNTDVGIKNGLETAAMQIKQFLGIQDSATTWLHQAAQKLSDSIYSAGFPKAALIPDHLLPKLRDPFAVIRSLVFHPKVGLFAIPQLWVQASTFANIFGISGASYAMPGTKAATFYLWSRINRHPEIMARLDELASQQMIKGTVSFKPGQFIEATQGLENGGFANVSKEHIYRDNTTVYNFLSNNKNSILNAGQWFFEKGEQSVRVGAWYTAYLEVRNSLKTTGRLTETQWGDVLQRADLLAGNMSRASASTLNKGVWSVPTQFQTFPLRMMEQISGQRLTASEKMRLFGVYATLYGIPGGFGLSGLPIGPYINSIAQDKGYVTGDKANSYINSAVTEGLPALLLAIVTGGGDASQGNWYNIQERYSMQGFDVFKDVLRGDKTFLDIVGGAAYSTLSSVYAAKDPFLQSLVDGIKGEGKHPFKIEDALDIFKEISSVSAGVRLYSAIQLGKWLSRKEANLGDVSPANAAFMTIFGLQPQGVNDVVNQTWTKDTEKRAQAKGLEIFIREMRRSFQERDNGNYSQADQYESRAYHSLRLSNYPQELYPQAMSAAAKDHESMIARSSRDYYLKNVPEDRKQAAQDAYLKFIRTYYKGQ